MLDIKFSRLRRVPNTPRDVYETISLIYLKQIVLEFDIAAQQVAAVSKSIQVFQLTLEHPGSLLLLQRGKLPHEHLISHATFP